jgi:peptide/nickel transport system substrate-binding protein
VRQALSLATDKPSLVQEILHGYGIPIESPAPPLLLSAPNEQNAATGEEHSERLARADALLTGAKWNINKETGLREKKKGKGKETETLSFSLATANAPELLKSAEALKGAWEKIGAAVDVKIFETGDLNQNVIRPRKYDALLFGEIIGRDLDLYPFWHSSQRNDPGLNIALYTNSKVDKLLEEGRRIAEPAERLAAYTKAADAISADAPAIFLYAPDFIYVLPEKIKGLRLKRLTIPSERFLNIQEWYTETEKIWKFLARPDDEKDKTSTLPK